MTTPAARTLIDSTWVARRWPTAAGILLAGSLAAGTWSGVTGIAAVAHIVTASGFVYLGAGALRRQAAAWPLFLSSFVLITIGFVVPAFNSTVWMLGIVTLLALCALFQGGSRPTWGIPMQTAALVVLAAVVFSAVSVGSPWAGLLISAALLAHAGWDVYHHRVDRVVARSMAEFCGVLDTLLALTVLVATISG